MKHFKYTSKDGSGQTVHGEVEGEDRESAIVSLRKGGHYILDIREAAERPVQVTQRTVSPFAGGVPVKELAIFYHQLGTLLKSGITPARAMLIMESQATNQRLRKVSAEISGQLNEGSQMSDAFARHPDIFPDLHAALLRAGELIGRTDEAIERIAASLEAERRLRLRLSRDTMYPKIVVIAAIFLPNLHILVLQGVVPYLQSTLSVALPLAAGIAALWMTLRIICRTREFRRGVDRFKLSIPKLGSIWKMTALARFYRTLASTMGAGVPLRRSLEISASVCGNEHMKNELLSAVPQVEQGTQLSEALGAGGIIPAIHLQMIATGERSGSAETMLNKAAEHTESEAELAIHQAAVAASVVVYLLVSLYVGYTVVSFYTGYFNAIMK